MILMLRITGTTGKERLNLNIQLVWLTELFTIKKKYKSMGLTLIEVRNIIDSPKEFQTKALKENI